MKKPKTLSGNEGFHRDRMLEASALMRADLRDARVAAVTGHCDEAHFAMRNAAMRLGEMEAHASSRKPTAVISATVEKARDLYGGIVNTAASKCKVDR